MDYKLESLEIWSYKKLVYRQIVKHVKLIKGLSTIVDDLISVFLALDFKPKMSNSDPKTKDSTVYL